MTENSLNKIAIFSMNSGLQVISLVVEELDEQFVLDFPLEIQMDFDDAGMSKMYLVRFMPYTDKGTFVMLNKQSVEAYVLSGKTMADYYSANRIKYETYQAEIDATKTLKDVINKRMKTANTMIN